jgi:hypothetical protein
MATNTYVALDTRTLSSATNTITFNSIPQTYTDLILVCSSNSNSGTDYPRIRVGTSGTISTTGYSNTQIYGTGSAAASFRETNQTGFVFATYPATSVRVVTTFQFQNYSNTTTYKTVLMRDNNPAGNVTAAAMLWQNTGAINTIELFLTNNFVIGSTFTLYGIAKDSEVASTAKATGGTITYGVEHTYHVFTSSGTFTPTQALTCDYLVIAGGGSGGYGAGGGGGAGGYRSTVTATGGGGALESPLSLTAQGYTVTIGAGGASQTNNDQPGNAGSNSVFSTITSIGGGRGGSWQNIAGGTGGSGGGGGASTGAGGAGTANQGYSGGANGGAGGGAGAPASNPNGGNGVSSEISGALVTRAGGGASFEGGTGGTGGGGSSVYLTSAGSGTANTGSGGAGSNGSIFSGAGGSGIVIIRYAN